MIADAAKKKFCAFDVDELLRTDDKRKDKLASIEKKRALQNEYNEKILNAVTGEDRRTMIDEMRRVKSDLSKEGEMGSGNGVSHHSFSSKGD